jgi:LPS-assembly lipoprotein
MIRSFIHIILAGLVTALLAGCGFHLRGTESAALPASMQKVVITGIGPTHPIGVELNQSLRARGAEVMQEKSADSAILTIQSYNVKRRVLSVSPVTGKVRELEIYLQVTFKVTGPTGNQLIQPQSVQLVRDYLFDENQVYGTSEQEATLISDLQRDAVQQMMFRINSQASASVTN